MEDGVPVRLGGRTKFVDEYDLGADEGGFRTGVVWDLMGARWNWVEGSVVLGREGR